MSGVGKLEARIVVPSGGWSFELDHSVDGTNTISLAAADEYYHSTAGSGASDLGAELKTQMDATGSTYTVTCDAVVGGTGQYTISVDAGTFSVTWVDVALRNLLGFTAGVSAVSSATGASQAKALWLPGGPVSKLYGANSEGLPRSSGNVQVASDGTYYAFHGPRTRRDRLEWTGVVDARVIAANESTANQSWETLWSDAIRGDATWAVSGKFLRWHQDADTDGTYQTYHALNATQPDVVRLDASFDGLWIVTLDVLGAG